MAINLLDGGSAADGSPAMMRGRSLSREEIRAPHRTSLGPWFHNIELAGMATAPTHFLGDYPQVKWRQFAHALPADLSGASVLDIGCNAGFYALEMKRRGAQRVLGIDFDKDYLAQARFAAEVSGLEIEFRELSVYDVAELRRTVRHRAVHGRASIICAIRCWRST